MTFQLPELPYSYDDLAPNIDAKTMEVHHSKHHAGYTNKLNKAIAGTDLEHKTIEEILTNLDTTNSAVRNNGGGYWNHSLFWQIMSPKGGGEPTGKLSDRISRDFGSFEEFKNQFSTAALSRFGSGWTWLCVDKSGKLEIGSTPNQDNPLMPNSKCNGQPILGLDVWEHAYYLQFQNRRNDYIESFFNVINWEKVADLFNKCS